MRWGSVFVGPPYRDEGRRAMRACVSRVFGDHALLPVTKTKPRSVPLSRKAIRTIERMRGWDDELVFGLKPSTLDAMFRKYRERAGLSGFTFHDFATPPRRCCLGIRRAGSVQDVWLEQP